MFGPYSFIFSYSADRWLCIFNHTQFHWRGINSPFLLKAHRLKSLHLHNYFKRSINYELINSEIKLKNFLKIVRNYYKDTDSQETSLKIVTIYLWEAKRTCYSVAHKGKISLITSFKIDFPLIYCFSKYSP